MKPEYEQYRREYTELWQRGETYKSIHEKLGIPFNLSIGLRLQFKLKPRMPTRYSIAGKLETVITDVDFERIMAEGMFKKEEHKGYASLVYYSAVRREEARRALRPQFQIVNGAIMFSVGKRLKHGIETPSLKLPTTNLGMDILQDCIENTRPGKRVFLYCPQTCYNIMRRSGFGYTHHCRLSRITQFFLDGWTVPQVRSWTGLSLTALNYYLGIVAIEEMSKSLR